MRSMTGYGRGRCEVGGRRLVVEIRSVNHRFLEIKQRLPWADAAIEQLVAQAIRKRLDRGALTVSVRDEGGAEVGPEVRVDLQLARAYHRALDEVRAACGLTEPPSLAVIAAQPGVLLVGESAIDPERLWTELGPGVAAAIDELVATREREGTALREDLRQHVERLRTLVDEVAALAAEAPTEARRRLQERLGRLVAPGDVDPQRLAQEVAILADRADVAEELTRLRAHLDEVTRLADAHAPSGRRLDFLAQELHREVNTIGSKAQRAEIGQRVVDAKTEVERLREQVQNVE